MIYNATQYNKAWKTKKLCELGGFSRGKSKHRPRNDPKLFEGGKYPLVQTGDIKASNLYITKHTQEYGEFGLRQSKLWDAGTLCITIAANIAETGILEYPMCFPDSVVGFNAYPDESSELFMHYVFTYIRNSIQNSVTGSIQDNINIDYLSALDFKVPEKPYQDKIVQVLSLLDRKIQLNNRISSELEAMAKTIFDYWFVQFDFPNALGKPYKSSGGAMVWNKKLKCEIPATWETTIINDVIAVKDGTHDSPKAVDSGYPLITSKHLMEWGLDFLSANLISESDYITINKRSKVDSGDILFSMIGSVGTVYKIDEKDINFAIKNVALYKTSENEEYKNFVYMWLKSYYMRSYMSNVLSGSIQKFIGLGDLRTMPIFVPNNETKSYYNLTRSIFEKSNTIREENQELTKLRDWLLPMLMNGQATVGD